MQWREKQLQETSELRALLTALKAEQRILRGLHNRYVPLALKIAPDLTDEQIDARCQQLRDECTAELQDFGNVRQHFDKAANGQCLEGKPRLAPGRLHPRTGDSDEARVRHALAHRADQGRCERISRRLACDETERGTVLRQHGPLIGRCCASIAAGTRRAPPARVARPPGP